MLLQRDLTSKGADIKGTDQVNFTWSRHINNTSTPFLLSGDRYV